MNISAYLERIKYEGALEPTLETLRQLQLAHLFAVPFENLSIHYGEPIVLTDEALFDKIVTKRRGGFCYELNGLFAALLRKLGFQVDMLSARVANASGEFGPDFDHMTLMVHLEKRWLVDVGFGDSYRQPLAIDERDDQFEPPRAYRFTSENDRLTLWQRDDGGAEKAQYSFTLEPFTYPSYAAMCRFHQTSPESHFTRARMCSLPTPDGRMTLSELKLITTTNGQRHERILKDESEFAAVLREKFGIVVEGQAKFVMGTSRRSIVSETRTSEQTDSSDESEVKQLYHDLLRAWNNRDAAGMAGLFEKDGISIGFDGSQYETAEQIESELSRIFASHPTPPYVGRIKETRMLWKDLGLVRAIGGMVPPGKSDLDPALNTVQSLLARKTDRWRIVLYQNTPAQFHGRSDLVEEMTEELRQLL